MGGFVKLFGITIISNATYLEGFNHKNQDTPWNFDTVWKVKIFLLENPPSSNEKTFSLSIHNKIPYKTSVLPQS